MIDKKIVQITKISTDEMNQILSLWERSVRASHFFLTEENIEAIKPLVEKAVPSVEKLFCIKNNIGNIKAFMGIDGEKLEMLFVDSDSFGFSIGKELLLYAINNLNVKFVDVNEENPKAVGFYEHLGFYVVERAKVDSQGMHFPILHMKLKEK